jgi:hypothetical protein
MGVSRMGDEMYDGSVQAEDAFTRRAIWRERFIFWPKRSHLTNRWLFCRRVIEGTAMWTGPGDPVFEYRYHEPKEHTLWQLSQ